jgi:1-deoxy-D-xylulose-5-phosphate reductoisomerase
MAGRHPGLTETVPRRRLTVLGATGSIGASTLDLIAETPGAFDITALTGYDNVDRLIELARLHRPKLAVIGTAAHYQALREGLAGTGIEAAAGEAALIEAATRDCECVIAAMVGLAGLKPALASLKRGRRIGLANKECLVSAGDVFMRRVAAAGCDLVPVDSEHSAVFQALAGADLGHVERITITASGGPFRTWDQARLATATVEDALRHPSWSMGRKITIDSATLFNKGLELIEAHHLFPIGFDRIDAVVHPQSIVHAFVAYIDGAVVAQLASPDMRTPIALALSHPGRMPAATRRLDLATLGPLTFEPTDPVRFPALRIVREAMSAGGTAPAILNAANEIAVEAFLDRRLGFLEIAKVVEQALTQASGRGAILSADSLDNVLSADRLGRDLANQLVGRAV